MVGLSRVVIEDRAASSKDGLIHTLMRGRGGQAGVVGGMVSSGGLQLCIFSIHCIAVFVCACKFGHLRSQVLNCFLA